MASDAEISKSIDELVQEEHQLWEAESRGEAGRLSPSGPGTVCSSLPARIIGMVLHRSAS